MTKYVVKDENTLGYLIPEPPNTMGILHASILKGSIYGRLDGSCSTFGARLRPATREDFHEYRVMIPPDFDKAQGKSE